MIDSLVRRESDVKETGDTMVIVEKVEKKVQVGKHSIFALNKCSLSVKAGETLAILGSSGTGKSTLIHLIAGLERPTSGEIRVKKFLVSEMSDGDRAEFRKGNVGVIYQFHHLLPEFNVLENVMMPLKIKRVPHTTAKKKAWQILEKVGLEHKIKDQPATLSGGERQRVAIARAMISMPSLILADEPTGNLDRNNAYNVFRLILSLVKDHASSLIVATHDLELAALCDNRKVLN
ncbi:MAG: ABC transporter ATP-binding protein [Burkholderiaceae bacterium]|nr:MAG: ABC transporter ATP-binding protein [Burkholderiaceae bacterium]|tara:strand:+ start:889 stop:1590 length:702 start_codon:yes stop_codon:yes gene_type:complete